MLYPYITGLVAGAFIMASLVRVFKVKALEPVYRLSLLTALSFLLCATLPLLFHLGHPERSYQILITPHFSSPTPNWRASIARNLSHCAVRWRAT